MAGVKGRSGRKNPKDEARVEVLRSTLIEAVLKDCAKNPARQLFWAEKFVNRLMPQEIKGNGKDGEIVLRIAAEVSGKYETPQNPS